VIALLEKIESPIFKKNYALRKILLKFTNKNYLASAVDAEDGVSLDDEIKSEICQILNYLLDVRQEMLVDNVMEYYHRQRKEEKPDSLQTALEKVLPPLLYEVGQNTPPTENKDHQFENFTKNEMPASFDEIIDRSFLEVILVATYFSNNATLQDHLVLVYNALTAAPKEIFRPTRQTYRNPRKHPESEVR
jgi:hypothetical protein